MHWTATSCRTICTSRSAFVPSSALASVFHIADLARKLTIRPLSNISTSAGNDSSSKASEALYDDYASHTNLQQAQIDTKGTDLGPQYGTKLSNYGVESGFSKWQDSGVLQIQGRIIKNGRSRNSLSGDREELEQGLPVDDVRSTEAETWESEGPVKTLAEGGINQRARLEGKVSMSGNYDTHLTKEISAQREKYQWKSRTVEKGADSLPMRIRYHGHEPIPEEKDSILPMQIRFVQYNRSQSRIFAAARKRRASVKQRDDSIHPGQLRLSYKRGGIKNATQSASLESEKEESAHTKSERSQQATLATEQQALTIDEFFASLDQMRELSEEFEVNRESPMRDYSLSNKEARQQFTNPKLSGNKVRADVHNIHDLPKDESKPEHVHHASNNAWQPQTVDEEPHAARDGGWGSFRGTGQMFALTRPLLQAEPLWMGELEDAIQNVEKGPTGQSGSSTKKINREKPLQADSNSVLTKIGRAEMKPQHSANNGSNGQSPAVKSAASATNTVMTKKYRAKMKYKGVYISLSDENEIANNVDQDVLWMSRNYAGQFRGPAQYVSASILYFRCR